MNHLELINPEDFVISESNVVYEGEFEQITLNPEKIFGFEENFLESTDETEKIFFVKAFLLIEDDEDNLEEVHFSITIEDFEELLDQMGYYSFNNEFNEENENVIDFQEESAKRRSLSFFSYLVPLSSKNIFFSI